MYFLAPYHRVNFGHMYIKDLRFLFFPLLSNNTSFSWTMGILALSNVKPWSMEVDHPHITNYEGGVFSTRLDNRIVIINLKLISY